MPRWIKNLQLTSSGDVDFTLIAHWWPTTYYSVITTEMKEASAPEGIEVLTRQLRELFPAKFGPPADYFVTGVHKANRFGAAKDISDPICRVKFANRAEAVNGHEQMVKALAKGRRHLSRLLDSWA